MLIDQYFDWRGAAVRDLSRSDISPQGLWKSAITTTPDRVFKSGSLQTWHVSRLFQYGYWLNNVMLIRERKISHWLQSWRDSFRQIWAVTLQHWLLGASPFTALSFPADNCKRAEPLLEKQFPEETLPDSIVPRLHMRCDSYRKKSRGGWMLCPDWCVLIHKNTDHDLHLLTRTC